MGFLYENKLRQYPCKLRLNGDQFKQANLREGRLKKHYKFKLNVAFFINFHFLHERKIMG